MKTLNLNTVCCLAGVLITLGSHNLTGATLYVSLDSPNPSPPYITWATAARVIQDAVDAASARDEIIVTNGVYASGGVAFGLDLYYTNRVDLTKPLTLRSVNGSAVTVITGSANTRCAFVGNGAILSGFTLTKGGTDGGGARCDTEGIVTNCVISGNSGGLGGGAWGGKLYDCALTGNIAWESGGGTYASTLFNCILRDNQVVGWFPSCGGGGASSSTLYNCLLTGNSAGGSITGERPGQSGGGALVSTLYNCTLIDNYAAYRGGGVADSLLFNCVVWFNQALDGANHSNSTFEHSCSLPLPPGPGNIDADPQLATLTHLSTHSPCAGAGNPSRAVGVDIDGEPWAHRAWALTKYDWDRPLARWKCGSTPLSPTWLRGILWP